VKPGDGLRDLARVIEETAREHPEWSRAHEIVLNCTTYLRAVAQCSDINHGVTDMELPQWPFTKGERK